MALPPEVACILCKKSIQFAVNDYACVGIKGLQTINAFSLKHNEVNPKNPIPIIDFEENDKKYVHHSCRKNHTNARRYEQMMKRKREAELDPVVLRSGKQSFCFRTDCYLCGRCVDVEKAKRLPGNAEYEYSYAMTLSIKDTIAKRCAERRENQADEWAEMVSHRIACISDLPAEEAIYHRRCFQYFMSPRNLKLDSVSIVSKDGTPQKKRGRPSGSVDEIKQSAFMHVIEYLENNDDETITLDELYDIMESRADTGEIYSRKSLQRQLYAHYGDRVSITSSKQKSLIVTLTSNVQQITADSAKTGRISMYL